MSPSYTSAEIAGVCHELNRAIQRMTGEQVAPSWEHAPDWMRESAISGVELHLAGDLSPEESHESWLAYKLAEGWVFGEAKDPEAKTHPLLVPYAELHPMHKLKDHVFSAVVRALGRNS